MAALAGAGAAVAREQATQEQRQNLTPEQREAARAQARERWKSMSPDEQAAAKQRMRESYESLSPEQQAQVRQRMQERKAAQPQSSPASGPKDTP
jgi:Spy/CpxP family protein refolding chaperone